MIPTVDLQKSSSIESFYDALAQNYDEMTGFRKRFIQEKPFFRLLVEKYRITTALDAGCGTGFHALLLAQLGIRVTAIDISPEMIQCAVRHARELKLSVEFRRAGFETRVDGKQFDAVFCLGNSLAHLLTLERLNTALQNFSRMLQPRGILFLQNLNYDRILARKERVQSTKESNGKTFIRFYDYTDERILFNLLTLEKVNTTIEQKLQSVELRPLRQAELASLLRESGFDDIKSYGGISMEEFHPASSKDLVMLARKAE
ncbi:MAG TPA: methyltransferase domain-containing protein [Bacteroidota bacterium]